MKRTIKYFFQSIFIYLFFLFAKIIGLKLSRKFFSLLFQKIGPLIRTNNIVNKNLSKLPTQLSSREKKEIKLKMWSNYGMTFIEYFFLKNFKKNDLHIKIKGEAILNEIYKKDKKVIFVSGHFANFELMSMEITKKKINLATIYNYIGEVDKSKIF